MALIQLLHTRFGLGKRAERVCCPLAPLRGSGATDWPLRAAPVPTGRNCRGLTELSLTNRCSSEGVLLLVINNPSNVSN